MARIFYILIGFVIGYMLDELRKPNQGSGGSGYDEMEEVEIIVTEVVKTEPEKAKESTPAEKTSAGDAELEDSPSFLKEVQGIGPTYAKRIFESGVRSMSALAEMTPENLADVAKVKNTDKVVDWIEQAKKLA